MVSIPSSIIASGFVEVVQSKQKTKLGEVPDQSGDDWFDIQYKNLANVDPPLSIFGPCVDKFQTSVHEYLDGYHDTAGNRHRTTFSSFGRFAFFSLIIANVVAVVLESVPEIDLYVGNEKNNFFDAFEAISVTFFTIGKLGYTLIFSLYECIPLIYHLVLQNIFYVSSLLEKVERHCTPHGFMQLHSSASLTSSVSFHGMCNGI